MALLKIYTEPKNFDQARANVARSIKLVAAASLNCPEIPTGVNSIETVLVEGIDLIGIDYIIEVVACERPSMQKIANNMIAGLSEIHPDLLFSVYFNLIESDDMANSPRPEKAEEILTMSQAIAKAKG